VISRVKTSVPAQPDWVIPRTRLTERLSRGVRGPLTVLTAPPGAGKTVTAAEWAATGRAPGPVAWVSLDAADHDPDRFWSLVSAALANVGVETVSSHPNRYDDVFYTELGSVLAARPSPAVLVLDDFRPDAGSSVVDGLVQVSRTAGPLLRLVLISRRDPPLPLHRYRLTGELCEIRADTLAFVDREIQALLAQHCVSLSAESVRALRERTEGWAAGLRLAAMSMERHPDPAGFAAQFAGDDHAVVGYLMDEVLEAQPPDMRHLLLATSVADRFDAELAAELAGPEAGRGFAAMVRQNSFVLPLGHGWFRYHHMFGAALNLMLRHETPGEVAGLHRRAAAWHSRQGQLADAVHHAAEAQDWRYASWLIIDQQAIGHVLGLGSGRPSAGFIGGIPERALSAATEPEPALVAAAAAVARGDEDACTANLARADRILGSLPDDHALSARLAAGLIRLARSGPRELPSLRTVVDSVDELLDRLPGRPLDDHPELRALVLEGHGTVDLWCGRLVGAATAFRAALLAATGAGNDFLRRESLGKAALAEALLGRFRQAAESSAKATQLPEVSISPAGRRVGVAHLAAAWVALGHNRLDEARLELNKTRLALQECPDGLMSALCGLVAARTEIIAGSSGAALELLGAAREDTSAPLWVVRRMSLVEAEAHAAGGAPITALATAWRAGEDGGDLLVVLARAQLDRGDPSAASQTLRPALSESNAVPNDVRVEAWLLDARLAYDGGDLSRGRRSLDRALRLGEREQVRLPFAMVRSWLVPVLRRDPELLQPHRRLLEPIMPPATAASGVGSPAAETEQRDCAAVVFGRLSVREVDVLRHLSEMMTTEEIATEMYVSVNTVKTHLKSIYRKLAVTRRGEAVRRARHLELL
jgi:LuxR family maltose regulon positive regulatory protein